MLKVDKELKVNKVLVVLVVLKVLKVDKELKVNRVQTVVVVLQVHKELKVNKVLQDLMQEMLVQ